jgi:uncharacterized tellurite resistance protein B-like protein
VLAHLSAVVAYADGTISDQERHYLAQHLGAVLALDGAEAARLGAHLTWLTTGKPSLTGMKKRVDCLDPVHRSTMGRFLVDIAGADGSVGPEEITVLTKLYALLGLDEADVYRDVHALGTETGPVTVRLADPNARRWAIPAFEAASTSVRLDPEKVHARLRETATVTALLAGIFADEESVDTPATDTTPDHHADADEPQIVIAGLDSAHNRLADRLRSKATWTRAEAERLAASLALPLLDGAIDRINEAAIDACGEPLVDGDDPLEINSLATQELF